MHHTTVMDSIAKIDEQRRADLNRTINKVLEILNG
jgi:chromosomal replication initiator protein